MRRFQISVALTIALAVVASTTATVAAHNAGCVQTGNGDWVFVGSNKSSPAISANSVKSSDDPPRTGVFLDLTPQTTGDQYGARYAAEISPAVERPNNCQPGDTPAP
jgi:hypothetical protein